MWVENRLDEVRIGVKGQSNLVIARSPRNSFRASLMRCLTEVEILDGLGGIPAYRIQPNSECRKVNHGSQTACDKVRSREGKNPERWLRSRRVY